MVKIINAFQGPSPISKTISDFGTVLFGDRLGNKLKQEQAYAAEMNNVETQNLMDALAISGNQRDFYADPANLARIVGSGYKPDDLGKMFLQHGVSQYGVRSDQADEGIVGAGGSYSSGANAFDIEQANKVAEAQAKQAFEEEKWRTEPVAAIEGGQPAYVPREKLTTRFDVQPPMSNSEVQGMFAQQNFGNMGDLPQQEQTYLGADPSKASTPRNYIMPDGKSFITYDGRTDAQSGQQLPPGGYIGNVEGSAADVMTKPSASLLEAAMIEHSKLDVTSKQLRSVVERAPDQIFGASGKLLSGARGATVFANNVTSLLGFNDAKSARDFFTQEAASQNLDPNLINLMFNPAHGEMELLAGLYVYQTAKAMYGQGGRDLSNQDVERVIAAVGVPSDWAMDKQRFIEKMNALDTLRAEQVESLKQMFEKGPSGALPNVSAPAAPSATTPTPNATQEERWERGPDGRPRRVQ